MTSDSFDRKTYLRDLDRFYVAIEQAARTMTDWSDKQYFLNTVYERFFQGYSVKLADTMGIVYTPQEIVDFMCASVAEVLDKEFGKKLWSDDVYIIDPCTGTGNCSWSQGPPWDHTNPRLPPRWNAVFPKSD